jgi:hypothetical protein
VRLRRGHPSSLRGAFTMAELLVYCSLVTMGLLLIGSVEMAANRAAGMQQSLIEIELQACSSLDRLRRDVEASQRVERVTVGEDLQQRDALLITLLDGRRVRYTAGERVELDADGGQLLREAFPAQRSLEFELTTRAGVTQVLVEATFVETTRSGGEVRRVHRRTAQPRREVGL